MKHPNPVLTLTLLQLVTCLGASSGTAHVHAAEQSITIAQTIRTAIANNLDLQREKVLLHIADANMLAAEGRFDVTLVGGLSFSQRILPPVSVLDITAGLSNRIDLTAGVQRQLESGGRLAFNINMSPERTEASQVCGPGRECMLYDASFSLRFDQPLLRGYGKEFTLAALKRRKLEFDQAAQNRQARVATILRDIVGSYWELAYASRELAIRRSAVDLAQKQLEATNAQIQVGQLAPIARAAVERAIAERKQDVALAEQNLYLRGITLRRLSGQSLTANLDLLVAAEVPHADPLHLDVNAELARTLERNPQLSALRMGVALSELDLMTARSLVKPQLDAFAQIGNRGRSVDSVGPVFDQLVGFDNLVWSTGFTFQMPIQNRAARGQREAARANIDRTMLDASALELELREATLRFAMQIMTAGKRLTLARETVIHASKNLQAEEAQFQVGRTTNNDVLLRQQELKLAELQVVRATVDLLLSEIALQALTGDLLDRYGVTLAGI